MTTQSLPSLPSKPNTGTLSPSTLAALEVLATTPLPPFHLLFPTPKGYGRNHPLYELRQAANRIYTARRSVYRSQASKLSASDLQWFVQQDVLSRLCEEEEVTFGPLRLSWYRWIDRTKFRAFLPWHRERIDALYIEFKAGLPKRRIQRAKLY